jgi:hypothetical protein
VLLQALQMISQEKYLDLPSLEAVNTYSIFGYMASLPQPLEYG